MLAAPEHMQSLRKVNGIVVHVRTELATVGK